MRIYVSAPEAILKPFKTALVVCLFIAAATFAEPRKTELLGTDQQQLLDQVSATGSTRVIVGVRTEGGWQAADNLIPEKAAQQKARVRASKDHVLRAHPKVKETNDLKFIPFFELEVDEKALRALMADDNITSIEGEVPIHRVLAESTNIVQSRAANLRGYSGSASTVVAIIDDGVEKTHPFLYPRVGYEACFASDCGPNGTEGPGTGLPCGPACDHGTQVAGIVAGSTTNLYGVAPQAWLASVRVFKQCGSGCQDPNAVTTNQFAILKALEWVYDHRNWNFAAVNLSLKYGNPQGTQRDCFSAFPAIDSEITNLWLAGIAVVAASGNDGTTTYYAPACMRQAYAVGATYDDDTFAYQYSNAPPNLAFLAPGGKGHTVGGLPTVIPGEGIYSSAPGGWRESYGTSLAAPHVAGAFAVLRSAAGWTPSLTSLYDALRSTGTPVMVTPGLPNVPRINVDAAVRVFRP